MSDKEIAERYQLSRQAYLSRQDVFKLFGIENVTSQNLKNKTFSSLRARIKEHLDKIGKKLDTESYLPTDLVFKYADNQMLLKQIEKDYAEMLKRKN